MLADAFGSIGHVTAEGIRWQGAAQTRAQKPGEVWCVQMTYQGKSWVWGARGEKAARQMAETMKGKADVKNVRVWRGRITWEQQ